MEDNNVVQKSKKKSELTFILILAVFLTCSGSSFLYGYNMAVLNLPGENIKCFLNKTVLNVSCKSAYDQETNNTDYPKVYTSSSIDANFLYAQANTIFVVAGIIGAFSSGIIADLLGRRNGLLFNHIFMIIGGLLNSFTVQHSSVWLLYIGRFFIGINAGLTIGLASMYLMEIAPRNLRGLIGACHQLAVTIGIVMGYIFTMTHTFNTERLWPVACGIAVIPAVVSLIVLPFCPESPRFTFMNKEKEEDAKKAFVKFNKSEDVDVFIGELKEEKEVAKRQEKFKFTQLFTMKDLRMPLLIACVIQIMQQLSGINAVITYSSSMLKTAGIPTAYSQYCVIGIGVLNVIASMVSLPLIEKLGRRTLLLWPSALLMLSLLFLTITVNLANAISLTLATRKIFGILSVILIFLYIIGFACGLGPVPGMIVAEIFRQEPRAAAYSVSQAIQWTSNLIVLFSFPIMDKVMGGYSFLPFLVVALICWIFFYMFMPETKNRTFDEVAKDLAFGTIVIGKKKGTIRGSVRYEKPPSDEKDEEHIELN